MIKKKRVSWKKEVNHDTQPSSSYFTKRNGTLGFQICSGGCYIFCRSPRIPTALKRGVVRLSHTHDNPTILNVFPMGEMEYILGAIK